jgi:cytosine/adenosine deaminase-related metal-dependent hydrolase
MTTLLIKHADVLLAMDAGRRVIRDGGIYARENVIEQVGPTWQLPATADRVIDASGRIVLPGLVNTHHHLYQTLTRNIPAVQDAELFDWLKVLYRVWGELTEEGVYWSARVGLAELLLSGCTTSSDHLYLYPNDCAIDAEIKAAQELGIRFQPCRGSMSLGTSRGGLPPDSLVEGEEEILADCERVISRYHDPKPYAMCRIVLAPCSPFSVTPELMGETRAMAQRHGVYCHTHLAETRDEEGFCREKFGCRPLSYAQRLGWLGEDVWFAHAIHLNDDEVKLLAETKSGVAHCPTSNMRLGSGIAPVRDMVEAGVKVGLAVDGSASNDSSHMLAEVRQAMLLQRIRYGAAGFSATQALEAAIRGGAAVLGRDDIGSLEPGKAADIVAFRLDCLDYAGALHDPVAALVFCAPQKVDLSVIDGRVVVQDGAVSGLDIREAVSAQNRMAKEMVARAERSSGLSFDKIRGLV